MRILSITLAIILGLWLVGCETSTNTDINSNSRTAGNQGDTANRNVNVYDHNMNIGVKAISSIVRQISTARSNPRTVPKTTSDPIDSASPNRSAKASVMKVSTVNKVLRRRHN
jgi:hypothetical protein